MMMLLVPPRNTTIKLCIICLLKDHKISVEYSHILPPTHPPPTRASSDKLQLQLQIQLQFQLQLLAKLELGTAQHQLVFIVQLD